MNAGNYNLEMRNMKSYGSYSSIGRCSSMMKLNGSAKGRIYFMANPANANMISSISGIGTMAFINDCPNKVNMVIPRGITNVTYLEIYQGINVNCEAKDVSIKNLTIFGKEDEVKKDSKLQAKNITVAQNTVLSSAILKAGTTTVGDGKIVLNHVSFENLNNHLEGKVDKKGNTLVEIKGTVDYADSLDETLPAAIVGLCLSNSAKHYVQLAEGLALVKATKAGAEAFRPYYDGRGEMNGPTDENPRNDISISSKMGLEAYESYRDEQNNILYRPMYGLCKKGNNLIYGRLAY